MAGDEEEREGPSRDKTLLFYLSQECFDHRTPEINLGPKGQNYTGQLVKIRKNGAILYTPREDTMHSVQIAGLQMRLCCKCLIFPMKLLVTAKNFYGFAMILATH